MTSPSMIERRSPLRFFLLVFALSIPLWLVGALISQQILPGLPLSSLSIIVPMTAALILVYRENRTAGVRNLLKRSFDYKRVSAKIWYAPILLLGPGVMALSYGWMRLMGTPVPPPQFTLLTAFTLFITFLIAGFGEEIGWMGYAYDPMQDRTSALQASILLGLVWAAWHIVLLVQVDRAPVWIAWWSLATVSQRVLIVWIYNNTGKSVFAVALTHAMMNLSWQLFPINGSFYDPRITGLITALVAVIVVVIWGPRTLTRSSSSPKSVRISGA